MQIPQYTEELKYNYVSALEEWSCKLVIQQSTAMHRRSDIPSIWIGRLRFFFLSLGN